MVDTSAPVLDIENIVGNTFAIFFTKIFRSALILSATLAVTFLASSNTVQQALLGGASPGWRSLGFSLLFALTHTFVFAFMVSASYEANCGRTPRSLEIVANIVGRILPLFIISAIVNTAVIIGLSMLLVPGLWIAALCSAVIPAVLFEQAGFSAFVRSARLTRGHRWRIVGALLIIAICAVLPFVLLVQLGTMFRSAYSITWSVLMVGTLMLGTSILYTAIGVIYANLRDLERKAEPLSAS